MPIDVYTLCPGGTGKRIKFCCKDLVSELNQIDGMIEGDQYQAALARIDQVLASAPDRACLLELKAQLLAATDQHAALPAVIQQFMAKHPDNPVALAEQAMLVADEKGGRAAMPVFQQAMEACREGFAQRIYDAMGVVARALLNEGQIVAGRAIFYLQTVIDHEDQQPVEAIMQLNASPQIPLLLKDDPILKSPPADVPWAAQYQPVIEQVGMGRWQKAAQIIEQIIAGVPDSPVLWHNLATLRAWTADAAGAAEGLRRLAALNVPLEDAVEAETTALLMLPDALGDEIEVLGVTYPVDDVDAVQAALAGAAEVSMMPVDPAAMRTQQGPPPRVLCMFLDRPKLSPEATEFSDQSVPRVLAQALLFGRETDKAARIEIPAISAERWEPLRALLARLVPGTPAESIQTRPVGRISRSRELLRHDWALPRRAASDRGQECVDRLEREVILNRWPELPLGLLGGKTPRAAAADPALRIKLLAAVLLLQSWDDVQEGSFDFNQLRHALGLPTLGPIDPTGVAFAELPLIRVQRIEAGKLSDESLSFAFRRAVAFNVRGALDKLAREVVARPTKSGPDEKARAYQYLAEHAEELDKALEYIQRGRETSLAANRSCASWDFMELPLRMDQNHIERFTQLIGHLQSKHIEEPGVARSLMQFLVQIGALNPDGTPVEPAQGRPLNEPSLLAPGAGAEPGKLWTPDSAAGTPGTGGKLWTPD